MTKQHILEITQINEIPLLSEIPDCPKKLFYEGNLEILKDPARTYICIVGSRKHTEYGKEVCEMLIKGLQGYPVAIVSGLALGIDGLVHKIALGHNIPCVAVPGSGIDYDVLYPQKHVELAQEIVQNGGVILSEYSPKTRASPWSFPMRNRIMAGLSHATLVIEGEIDSGTLITARLALEYNREVLGVPGSIFSSTSQGPLSLIKNGGIPITSVDDLLVALKLKQHPLIRDASEMEHTLQKCSSEELQVLEYVSEPRTRDEIYVHFETFGLPKIQVILSMLEIRKLTEEKYGKIYRTYTMKEKSIYM